MHYVTWVREACRVQIGTCARLVDRRRGVLRPRLVRGRFNAAQHEGKSCFDPRIRGLLTITHVGRDRWRLAQDLSRDARSIMLGPRAEAYHATAWKLPEAFHVLPQGLYSFLERRDGEPFRQVVMDVPSYHPVVRYAPQPFAVFDNGTTFNTGPLGYAARTGQARLMMAFVPQYSFIGTPTESVVVPGKERGPITRSELPQSPFVYFGKLDGLRWSPARRCTNIDYETRCRATS